MVPWFCVAHTTLLFRTSSAARTICLAILSERTFLCHVVTSVNSGRAGTGLGASSSSSSSSEWTVEVDHKWADLLENCHFDDSRLVHQFDDTILNRIHLMVKYEKLDKGARKTVITRFLKRANDGRGLSNIGTEYIDRFACVLLNDRQVSRLCKQADLWPQVVTSRSRIASPSPLHWRLRKAICVPLLTFLKLWQQMAISFRRRVTSGDNSLGYGPKNHRHSGYFRLGNFLLGTQKMWKLWKLHADYPSPSFHVQLR